MSSTIIIALIVLLVVIIVVYVVSLVLRRQTENRIISLEERKEALFDLPIQEEFDAVKNMHLQGQSQKVFREWNQKWMDLSQNSFAELENHIFDAEQLNDSFRWGQARKEAEAAESQVTMMEDDAIKIRAGLNELIEQERNNSTKIQVALDSYDDLRNTIADNAEHYGTAIGEIEKQLHNIEIEFNQFVELNSSGDPVEAAEILENAEEHTIALREITERIPEINHQVDEEYRGQLEELEGAYETFKKEKYLFPETFNLEQLMKNIRSKLKDVKESLERFELDKAENTLGEVKGNIDNIYEIFEREYAARKNFEKNSGILKEYIEHTRENNRNLLLEIDHAMQSYILPDNEKSAVRSYQVRLDDLTKEADALATIKTQEEKEQPYSVLNRRVNAVISSLDEIQSNQININNKINGLQTSENEAKRQAELFESKVHMIKRYVEKHNLPGLPQDYLDLFKATSDRISNLFKELDKVRINMDTISHFLETSSQEMDKLMDATDNLIDKVDLSEQLIQYANRYKTSNPTVAQAIQRAMQLFERDRNFEASFNTISNAIEQVEPGATDRIIGVYNNTKALPEYRQ